MQTMRGSGAMLFGAGCLLLTLQGCGDDGVDSDAGTEDAAGSSGQGGAGRGAGMDASAGGEGGTPDGGEDPLMPEYKDGTRLKAQWWAPEDGEPLFKGWYDTKLEVTCEFRLAEDERIRCLPAAVSGHPVSTDERCADDAFEIHAQRNCEGTPQYAVGAASREELTCSNFHFPIISTVYRLGDELDAATVNGCPDALSSPQPPLYAIEGKTPVPPERFVVAELRVARFNSRLGVQMYVAEDGAQAPRSPYDTRKESACAAMIPDTSGVYRCLPLGIAVKDDNAFLDPECSKNDVAASLVPECSPEVAVNGTINPADCVATHEFFEINKKNSRTCIRRTRKQQMQRRVQQKTSSRNRKHAERRQARKSVVGP